MMQAITTRFYGPTDRRGPRVKATAYAGTLTIAWDHNLSVEDNHVAAGRMLAERNKWGGSWCGGALPNGDGYAFVARGDASDQAFFVSAPQGAPTRPTVLDDIPSEGC